MQSTAADRTAKIYGVKTTTVDQAAGLSLMQSTDIFGKSGLQTDSLKDFYSLSRNK